MSFVIGKEPLDATMTLIVPHLLTTLSPTLGFWISSLGFGSFISFLYIRRTNSINRGRATNLELRNRSVAGFVSLLIEHTHLDAVELVFSDVVLTSESHLEWRPNGHSPTSF